MVVEGETYYNNLDPILAIINEKCIQMDKDIKKKNTNLALEVVECVIKEMKENDPVFSKLFSRLEYVGSYFDGLRVKEPTEFDINLIMKLPLIYEKILVENTNVSAGFVKINISKAKNYRGDELIKRTIEKWCDHSGYLLQNKVREWMEGVMARCLGYGPVMLNVSSGQVCFRVTKSGPAFTLRINTKNDNIDVDLVFTIEFPKTKNPPTSMRWTENFADNWVVVPKPTENICFWRISFSKSEKKIIHQKYKLKLILRMLKAFRDANTNIPICSYFIKTLFLWESHNSIYYNDNKRWEKRQGYLFVYMLDKLYNALDNKQLPYYWHKNMNLFEKFSVSHMANMANQLKHIIYKINDLIKRNDLDSLKTFMLSLFIETPNRIESPEILQHTVNDNNVSGNCCIL